MIRTTVGLVVGLGVTLLGGVPGWADPGNEVLGHDGHEATGAGDPDQTSLPRWSLSKPLRRAVVQRSTPPTPAGVLGDNAITAVEVRAIVVKTLSAINDPNMTVAVVDRVGNILALYRDTGAVPGLNDDVAVGLARTAALFSNSRAPLSSRTVRFISGRNFPNGVAGTPSGALYGIENTNRGCALNVTFNPLKAVPASRSVQGIQMGWPCNAADQSGCGLGIVTGKFSYADPVPLSELTDANPAAVNPGGIPIYRFGASQEEDRLLGGVGVAGIPAAHAEFAAFVGTLGNGGTGPVFQFPLPAPGNVFIDGIRLPFVNQVARPPGTSSRPYPGDAGYAAGIMPQNGSPAPTGYLVGPVADPLGNLTLADVTQIVERTIAAANGTRAQIRLPVGFCTRMNIAITNLDGVTLALYRMVDTTLFSLDVSQAKARNAIYFSSVAGSAELGLPPGTAVTARGLGFGGQPLYPSGIANSGPGPFFDTYVEDVGNLATRAGFCQQGDDMSANRSGVVWFPGSMPLYRDGQLIGGLGVSGDGVEQDDYVTFLGATGYLPEDGIRIDASLTNGVRIPFLKFPINPSACFSPPSM
jgi:uncharacterized protein GlcG (DUF336 family)